MSHPFAGAIGPIQPATYRPYFMEALGLYIILAFFFAFFVWGSFHSATTHDSVIAVILAVVDLCFALAIRFRFFVQVDEDHLTAQGFFTKHSLRWSDINEVIAAGGRGIRGRGFYGPSVFKFRGTSDTVTINFKLFSRECSAVVFGKIKHLSLEITYPKDTFGF